MRQASHESGNQLPDFATSYPAATAALERAVHDLLASSWDEMRRRRAHEMAVALSEGAKMAGWKETGGVLQAMASLLALPLEEVIGIREAMREKLLELLGFMKSSSDVESA